jgi:hypothetical protein
VHLTRFAAGALLLGLAAVVPHHLAAQSSMFGIRGLGLPAQPVTPRTRATGGSFGLFDPTSDVNPAALANQTAVTASFVLTPSRRTWESQAGTASLRETSFPLLQLGGPVPGSRVGLAVSVGGYTDRDFKLASKGSEVIRGAPVDVFDTLTSLGGMSEIRLAGGVAVGPRTSIGGGFHFITGSSRIDARRSFGDSTFRSIRQNAELSYHGIGFSLGIIHQLTSSIRLAALIRSDTKAKVDVDTTRVYNVDLPYTFAAGAQIQMSRRLLIGTSGTYRTWSGANSDLLAQGGVGARNTLELSFGGEYLRNLRRPANLPIRLGARYARLPFPVVANGKPTEFSISAGTGTRFAQDRAGVDLALEHAWRSEGSTYKERALTLILGLSIRPYGETRR